MRKNISIAALLTAGCIFGCSGAFAGDVVIAKEKSPGVEEEGKTLAVETTEQILARLKSKAERGDAEAQSTLGFFYCGMKDVPQDYKEAAKWHRKAAEQGNVESQCSLGEMYSRGNGVPQDYKEAMKWYRKAAEQGNANAQNVMGNLLSGEKAAYQDYKEAVMWYRRASEQGNTRAQQALGGMYYHGKGVQQDFVSAYCFCNLAARKKDVIKPAGLEINLQDFSVELRGKAAEKLTPRQVVDAQAMSTQWVKDHPKEIEEVIKPYRKAADQGDAAAQISMGNLLYDGGAGVPQDYREAMKWYRKASEQGNAVAQRHLGCCYANGQGVPQDPVSAHCFLNLAASNGEASAVQLRDEVAERLTPKQLADAQAMASKWAKDHPVK